MDARRLYHILRRFDDFVVRRPTMPLYSPHRPMGGPIVPLPKEYNKWSESVDEETLMRFWFYISEGLWKRAKRLSGLPNSVIVELMEIYHADDATYRGAVSPEQYAILGIPLTRFKTLLLEADEGGNLYDIINNRHAPPYAALPKKTKKAIERLLELIKEEKK